MKGEQLEKVIDSSAIKCSKMTTRSRSMGVSGTSRGWSMGLAKVEEDARGEKVNQKKIPPNNFSTHLRWLLEKLYIPIHSILYVALVFILINQIGLIQIVHFLSIKKLVKT